MKHGIKTALISAILASSMTGYAAAAGKCHLDKVEETLTEAAKIYATADCAALVAFVGAGCEGGTFGFGTPGCILLCASLETTCHVVGVENIKKSWMKGPAKQFCDIAGKYENSPFILVKNGLESQKVDFQVERVGPNVHLLGNNWLEAGADGILTSNKMKNTSTYTVTARVKREGKKDIKLKEKKVSPKKNGVYVYYKDGEYRIKKTPLTHKK